jgi:hypothetical protein
MPRFATRSRKPEKLSKPLHSQLSTYALAAGAAGVSLLVLAPPANAQIVFTPVHETIGRDQEIRVDLNHDGIADLTIREIPSRRFPPPDPGFSVSAVPSLNGGGIKDDRFPGSAFPVRRGRQIGPSNHFAEIVALMAGYTSYGIYSIGIWPSARGKPRYLGIRFMISGETHYGWARVNVRYDPFEKDIAVLLSGYAYQTQADTAITAGDTGSGNADDASSGPLGQMVFDPTREPSTATLGALALGTDGLAIWRRLEPESREHVN